MKFKNGKLTDIENMNDITFCFEKDGAEKEATVSFRMIKDVMKVIDREVYYRQDVMYEIKDEVEKGYLPETALENTAYIERVLEKYTENRERDEGLSSDEVRGWDICLENAFDNVDYEDYEENKAV